MGEDNQGTTKLKWYGGSILCTSDWQKLVSNNTNSCKACGGLRIFLYITSGINWYN